MFVVGSPSELTTAGIEFWLRKTPWANDELLVSLSMFDRRKMHLAVEETANPFPGKFIEIYQMFRDTGFCSAGPRSMHLSHGDVVAVCDERVARVAMLVDTKMLQCTQVGLRYLVLRFGGPLALVDLGTLSVE